jgi:hypothetical protein
MSKKLTWFELNKPWYPREVGKKYINLKPVQKVNKTGAFIIKNPKGPTWKAFYDTAINLELESDREYRAGSIEKAYKTISEALNAATWSANLKHAQILREKQNHNRGGNVEAYMALTDLEAVDLIDKISDIKNRLAAQIYGTKHEKVLKQSVSSTEANPAGSKPQSIVFRKTDKDSGNKLWTLSEAKAWLQEHNYHYGSVDETENTFRFRQESPEALKVVGTKTIYHGQKPIMLAIGVPTKNPLTPLTPSEKKLKKDIEKELGEKVDFKVINEPQSDYFNILKKGVENV